MNARLMRFRSAVIRDGGIWCVPLALNWLFKIDLQDWSVKGICSLGTKDDSWMEFLVQYQDTIWCIADHGVRIAGYHVLTGETSYFKTTDKKRRNLGVFEYGGMLWLFPRDVEEPVLCFDPEKKVFSVHREWTKECRRNRVRGRAKSFCLAGAAVYFVPEGRSELLKYDLREKRLNVRKIPGRLSFQYLFRAHNAFYLTSHVERKLFRWDEAAGELKEFPCSYSREGIYLNAVEFENGILLFNRESEDKTTVDFFDVSQEKISPYQGFGEKLSGDDEKGTLFFYGFLYDGGYVLAPWRSNKLFVYSRERCGWESRSLEIPKDIFDREYVWKQLEQYRRTDESKMILEDFLDYEDPQEGALPEGAGKQASVGSEIYKSLMDS